MNDEQFSMKRCPVCDVAYTEDGFGEKRFYWTGTGASATSDQVYSKVCNIAKAKRADGAAGCVNSQGKKVDGLGWGESELDKIVMQEIKFDGDS